MERRQYSRQTIKLGDTNSILGHKLWDKLDSTHGTKEPPSWFNPKQEPRGCSVANWEIHRRPNPKHMLIQSRDTLDTIMLKSSSHRLDSMQSQSLSSLQLSGFETWITQGSVFSWVASLLNCANVCIYESIYSMYIYILLYILYILNKLHILNIIYILYSIYIIYVIYIIFNI